MPPWRMQTLPYPAPQVLEAAVAAARDLGFGTIQVDRAGGYLHCSQPRRLGRRELPLILAVTDSGLGSTVLRVAWDRARPSAWPMVPRGRCAGRLCDRIRALLAGGAYP